jgi:hypothetical protein
MSSCLQQRTGPTKENALLRAELELLRGHNADLAARLQLAEGQLGQRNRCAVTAVQGPGSAFKVPDVWLLMYCSASSCSYQKSASVSCGSC